VEELRELILVLSFVISAWKTLKRKNLKLRDLLLMVRNFFKEGDKNV
jgi:hypothetical protein